MGQSITPAIPFPRLSLPNPWPRSPFPLGVMCGDPGPTQATVWTHFRGIGPLRLTVKALTAGEERTVFDSGVPVGKGGKTHVSLEGLQPSTDYRYEFSTGIGPFRRTSGPGHFKTAPNPDSLDVVTFGGTSCTNKNKKNFPTLEHAAARNDLEFMVHLGDQVYCDPAKTVPEYEKVYDETYRIKGMKDLHRAHGQVTLLDDHEIGNNWDGEKGSPEQLSAALETFRNYVPLRPSPEHPASLWRSLKFGKAAELFLLDTRTERKPSTRLTPNATFLSEEQMAWLKEGLKSSSSVFKFVVTSVPIGDFPWAFDVKSSDRWEGYPSQRRELLNFILENKLEGVWFLAGDLHLGAKGHVGAPGTRAFALPEVLVGPGASSQNPGVHTLSKKQWEFANNAFNFGVFRVDPKEKTLELSFVDEKGKTLFHEIYGPDGQKSGQSAVRPSAVPSTR